MTNESYNKIKAKYDELILKREKCNQLNSQLKRLEELRTKLELNLDVQAYVSTLEQIDKIKQSLNSSYKKEELTDEKIIYSASYEIGNGSETNNIYVYMGTFDYDNDYDIVHGPGVIKLSDNATDFGWKSYRNIELRSFEAERQVSQNGLDKFEKENTILYAPKGISAEKFYYQVRNMFFETLVKFGQEEAVKVISLVKK